LFEKIKTKELDKINKQIEEQTELLESTTKRLTESDTRLENI